MTSWISLLKSPVMRNPYILVFPADNIENKEKHEGDKEEGEEETQPRALHQTCSIFLRNLAPTITKQEVEAVSFLIVTCCTLGAVYL